MPSLSMQTISPVSFVVESSDSSSDNSSDDSSCSSASSSSGDDFFCPCSLNVRRQANGQPTLDTLDRATSHYATMRLQETKTYHATDFLSRQVASRSAHKSSSRPATSTRQGTPIDAACREKMVAWCYQVTDYCAFSRSTVEVAMSLLDRFLSHSPPNHPIAHKCRTSRKTYQLAAMTALYSSIKIIEPAVFDPAIIASLGRGCVTEEQVVEMERHLLAGVQWSINHPTAAALVYSLVDLLPAPSSEKSEEQQARYDQIKASLLTLSLHQTELAVSDYELVPVRSSTIALAALINAVHAMEAMLDPTMVTSFLGHVQNVTGVHLCHSLGLEKVMDRLSTLVDDDVVETALAAIPAPIEAASTDCASFSSSTASTTSLSSEQDETMTEFETGSNTTNTDETTHITQVQPHEAASASIYQPTAVTCDYVMELNDTSAAAASSGSFSRRTKRRGSTDSLDSLASADSAATGRSVSPTCIIRGAARQAARYARYLPQ